MKNIEVTKYVNAMDFMAGVDFAIGVLKCYPLWGMLKVYADNDVLDLNDKKWVSDQEDFMITLESIITKEAVVKLHREVQK
ncbi:MAG: hypothetical protein V4568_18225 [Pseudomonadota bacterium]